jgi:hypothetical protein
MSLVFTRAVEPTGARGDPGTVETTLAEPMAAARRNWRRFIA